MKILFATTNQAKLKFYATRLSEKGIELVTLDDLKISQDVEEKGSTPTENAIIKAKAYNEISGLPTIAVDDCLFLDNVPDSLQPETNVRRVNGKRLNDREMLEHYINLVNQYGFNGVLRGYFLKGAALVYEENIQSYEDKTSRTFINRQSEIINEGYPLSSIQFIPAVNKFKSELTREEESLTKDIEYQRIFDFLFNAISNLEKSQKGDNSVLKKQAN